MNDEQKVIITAVAAIFALALSLTIGLLAMDHIEGAIL